MTKFSIIVLLAAVLAPMAAAQMRGGPRTSIGGTGFKHFRSGGFGYPFFYSDYGPEPAALPPAPPVVVEKRIFPPERPAEPLLIEWHGDHFVRYGGEQTAQSPDYAGAASATKAASIAETSHEIPPAVLVYRDGHREEVSDYVITRGVLYARSNYPRNGSWMRNIQLSSLDLSATLQTNQDSGVRFVLPAGPNEVVTRP
jgi:hypothetical protein